MNKNFERIIVFNEELTSVLGYMDIQYFPNDRMGVCEVQHPTHKVLANAIFALSEGEQTLPYEEKDHLAKKFFDSNTWRIVNGEEG